MKKIVMAIFFLLLSLTEINGQNTVKGIILDDDSRELLKGVFVQIKNTSISQTSDLNGAFLMKSSQGGKFVLEIKFAGYETQNIPIELSGNVLDLGKIFLFKEVLELQDLSFITLTDDELNDDASSADNIS